MRILLIGKNGQVGGELAMLLPHLADVTALDRHQLDLSNPTQIRQVIGSVRPELIVNAAAYTSVDQAEREEAEARIINADAPALMAEEAKKVGAALVHYSTDYVFDGTKDIPYEEHDSPNPIGVYGKTKLAGEQAIRNVGIPYLIFRTSWVFGTRGRNFLLTILRLATERVELRIVRDQIGAPTWSREIAKGTLSVLAKLLKSDQEELSKSSGIYHMSAAGHTSWAGFAEAILEEASRMSQYVDWFSAATSRNPLITRCISPIATSEYPTLARRPAYSVLSNLRVKQTFGLELPDWRIQLRSVFAEV